LHTPQNELASRLQTLLVKRATASGNVETVQAAQTISTPAGASFAPEVQSVKFSNDDIVGWLQMAPEVIFKPPKAEWVAPPPVPQTIADNARIALFADWGTGLYGAPAIARSIEGLDRSEVVLHLGDTYYFGEDDEPHPKWGFKGRCIGHGGFPGFRDDLAGSHPDVYQWVTLPAQPQAPKAQLLDGPNFWIPQDTEGYSPMVTWSSISTAIKCGKPTACQTTLVCSKRNSRQQVISVDSGSGSGKLSL
jgi:hypothetical protein